MTLMSSDATLKHAEQSWCSTVGFPSTWQGIIQLFAAILSLSKKT